MMRLYTTSAACLILSGCSLFGGGSAKPAETSITPGRSEMTSQQEVQQPSTTRIKVTAERLPESVQPAPAPPAVVRVRIRVGE